MTDALHATVTPLIAVLPSVAVAVAVVPFQIDRLAVAINTQPAWLQIGEAFALRELLIYWAHRISHELPSLWRLHAIHHSSPRLDWQAGERRHPIDQIWVVGFTVVPMALSGFGAVELRIVALGAELWDLVIHGNVNWRLRFLAWLWVTPEYHHWHHSKDREARDRNYSGALPIWDLVFGTYYLPAYKRLENSGIPGGMEHGYVDQLAYPFRTRPEEETAGEAMVRDP